MHHYARGIKMQIKMKSSQIFVKDIEDGMIIARDVFDSEGGLLLAEGFEIKEAYKAKRLLNQHKILFLKVLREEIEIAPALNSIGTEEEVDIATLNKAIEEINENKEILKESLNKFITGEDIRQEEIENVIENTLKLFQSNINVFQIMQSVKDVDDITYAHCQNVSLVSYSIGQWMELDREDLEELALTGMLIDIGKTKVDSAVLNKKEKLSNDEFAEMKKHSIFSHEVIKEYGYISERVKRAVLFHHERMDGSGYPMGLKGNSIPLFSRIVAIADVYNALISHRPHRNKKTPFEAIRVLETEYMDKLDPSILYLFLRRIAANYIGQRVKLNNGQSGEIIFIPQINLHRPILKIKETDKMIDLSKSDNAHLDIVEFI